MSLAVLFVGEEALLIMHLVDRYAISLVISPDLTSLTVRYSLFSALDLNSNIRPLTCGGPVATVPSLTSASFAPYKGLFGRDAASTSSSTACVAKTNPPLGSICNVKGTIWDTDGSYSGPGYLEDFFQPEQVNELGCARLCASTEGCKSFYWIDNYCCEL